MTDPDRKLAGKARRGDRRALTRLYERHAGRLLGFLVRNTGSRQVAEDVLQETWTKVIGNIEHYRAERGTFRSWLYRIASNAAVDRTRRDALRSGPELDAPVNGEGTRRIDLVVSAGPDTAREGESRMLGDAMREALLALPAQQRAAVLLRHRQGMNYREIAAALSVPEGTAKTMVFRGVARIRERLSEWIDA
jgi:RNA polymerase sigma-70 factor (ECF subfamily)